MQGYVCAPGGPVQTPPRTLSAATYPDTVVFSQDYCLSANTFVEISGNSIVSLVYSGNCCNETPTPTPDSTQTPTPTPTNTETQTPTPTETLTSTPTETQTQTPTQTSTQTSTQTQTPTQTSTTTLTATPTPTTFCYCFSLTNEGDPTNTNTTTWTDCDGNPQSIVNKIFNSAADYFCAIDGTVSYSAGLTVNRQYPCTGSCP